MGSGPGLTGSFAFVFGHNAEGEGEQAFPLTSSTSPDTVLATGADQNFLDELGLPPDFIEAEFLNVPFHQVQIIVNPLTAERAFVPSELEAPGFAPSRSLPNSPITLGKWLKARGLAFIRCRDDGTSNIRLLINNLVENGVYTVWGLWGFDTNGDGIEDVLEPAALG